MNVHSFGLFRAFGVVLSLVALLSSAHAQGTLLSEGFEDTSNIDPRISIVTHGVTVVNPGAVSLTNFGSTKAFGFGKSDCFDGCGTDHETVLHIVLGAPTYVNDVSFKEMELDGNIGSTGQAFADGVSIIPAGQIWGRVPENDGQADVTFRTHTYTVNAFVTVIDLKVTDISFQSELFVDDILIRGTIPVPAPPASYIIPDIGTPGMNTYAEIIGSYSGNGAFGPDGIYSNNLGDVVRVVPTRAADTAKIAVGPVVVSWGGRLISTQIFVKPGVSPNSADWRLLSSAYRIPLSIEVGMQRISADTFYLVQKQHFGEKLASGVIGSKNGWGIRSRRGAMIVDSIILNGAATYTVDTSDCDASTVRNEGYLPLVVLSNGNARIGPNARLDASATSSNGAPGGGGGGKGEANRTTPPGQGYTKGGGAGPSLGFCDPNRGGINGAPGGDCSPGDEGGGGGTGFPFSSGGLGGPEYGSCTGTLPERSGGGGGMDSPMRGGAGGAFGSAGVTGAGCTNGPAGVAVGNSQLVPLAGGSGGGGSEGENGGGNGGGGGGAISIYGKSIDFQEIDARGGNGQFLVQAQAAGGGGGAGGGIQFGGKLAAKGSLLVQASGGAGGLSLTTGMAGGAGGAGRFRFDGPVNSSPVVTPVLASQYRGPSTDTAQWVARTFVLTGTGNGQPIRLYVRPITGAWTLVGTVSGYGANSWAQSITLPGLDSEYFLVAAQQVPSPSGSAYTAEPAWVFSQVACNILHCRPATISASHTLDLGTELCTETLTNSMWVKNPGQDPLRIDSVWLFGQQSSQLTLLSPVSLPLTVRPGDSVRFTVRWQPIGAGLLDAQMFIFSNDTLGQWPFQVHLIGHKEYATYALSTQQIIVDPLYAGRVRDTSTTFFATGTITEVLYRLRHSFGPNWIALRDSTYKIHSGIDSAYDSVRAGLPLDQLPLWFHIHAANDTGWFETHFRLVIFPCQESTEVVLRVYLTSAIVSTIDTARLPSVLCDGGHSDTTVWVHNTGNAVLTIDTARITGSGPRSFSIFRRFTYPLLVAPGDSIAIPIHFLPTFPGTKNSFLELVTNDSMPNHNPWRLPLKGTKERVEFTLQDSVVIVDGVHAGTAFDTSTVFTNTGTAALTILSMGRASGPLWITVSGPAFPNLVGTARPTSTLGFHIQAPRDTGWWETHFTVNVSPCGLLRDVAVRVHVVSGILAVTPSLDLGSLICASTQCGVFYVRNVGNAMLTVSGMGIAGGDTQDFSAPTPAPPVSIAPMDSAAFRVCMLATAMGVRSAGVWIASDDSLSVPSIHSLSVTGRKDTAEIQIFPDTLNVTVRCSNAPYCVQSTVRALGTVADTIDRFDIVTVSDGGLNITAMPLVAVPGTDTSLTICMDASDTGVFHARLVVHSRPCDRTHVMVLTVHVPPSPKYTAVGPADTTVCPGVSVTRMIRVVNQLNMPETLSVRQISPDPAFAPLPATLALNPRDTITLPVAFTSPDTGTHVIAYELHDTCGGFIPFSVTVHVRPAPDYTVAIDSDTVTCPTNTLLRKVTITNKLSMDDTIRLRVVRPTSGLVLSADTLALGTGALGTTILNVAFTAPNVEGMDTLVFDILDACGGTRQVAMPVLVRRLPLKFTMSGPSDTLKPGIDRWVTISVSDTSILQNVQDSDVFVVSLTHEVNTMDFADKACPCALVTVDTNRLTGLTTITIKGCHAPIANPLLAVGYHTVVGDTLRPTVSMKVDSSGAVCLSATGNDSVTIALSALGCELSTLRFVPFTAGISVFPSPVGNGATVRYTAPQEGMTRLTLRDPMGTILSVLANGMQKAGMHETHVDTKDFAQGMYFLVLENATSRVAQPIVVVH